MELSDVIRNLKGKREALDIALNVLESYANTIEAPAAPAPAQPMIAAPAEERPRRGGRRKKKVLATATVRSGRKRRDAEPKCDKHPNATEFDDKGRCRLCARQYARDYAERKKKERKEAAAGRSPRATRPARPPIESLNLEDDVIEDGRPPDPDADFDDELDDEAEEAPRAPQPRLFIWSKPTRCPKCGETTRLRRLANANLAKDAWIHPGPKKCIVKIAHYQIKDDRKYQEDVDDFVDA